MITEPCPAACTTLRCHPRVGAPPLWSWFAWSILNHYSNFDLSEECFRLVQHNTGQIVKEQKVCDILYLYINICIPMYSGRLILIGRLRLCKVDIVEFLEDEHVNLFLRAFIHLCSHCSNTLTYQWLRLRGGNFSILPKHAGCRGWCSNHQTPPIIDDLLTHGCPTAAFFFFLIDLKISFLSLPKTIC